MFHPVKAPKHYAGDGEVECKRALKSMLHNAESVLNASAIYWWGCALKYLWRWPWKNGKQDIEKCKECIECLLEASSDFVPDGQLIKSQDDEQAQSQRLIELAARVGKAFTKEEVEEILYGNG